MSVLIRLLKRRTRAHRRDRGAVSTLVALALVPVTAVTAVGVDGGRVFVERQRIQTSAEAAALAAGEVWASSGTSCAPSAMALVQSNSGASAIGTCSTAGSRTNGIVTVDASNVVPATFAKVIGRSSSTVSSTASVKVGAASSATGLRPFGICEANTKLAEWKAGGMSSTQIYDIYFSEVTSAVCGPVPGNWAVMDFDGGSNPTSEIQRWIDQGYSGSVAVGTRHSGQPGIPSPSLTLDSILNDPIVVPVFRYISGSGSNSIFEIEGFVGVTVTADVLNGSASQRHLSVRFARVALAGAQMAPGSAEYGVVTWRPCSFDGKGVCS